MDVIWGLMACMPVGLDSFVSAHHVAAGRFVPRPKSVAAILERLHRPRPPETQEEILAWAAARETAREVTARGLRSAALQSVDVSSFTRQALRLPSAPMGPFKGIRPSGSSGPLGPV